MSTLVKYVVGHTYKPLLEKYLSRKRTYRYNGFRLEIPPEVFHPGFFFSTRFLMRHLAQFRLQNKSFLELGAGSGLIAIHAAKEGAQVTATDINRTAVKYLDINARANRMNLDIVHSDLFEDLPVQQFDFIILNPPYYKRDAKDEKDLAWCCGSNGEYFERLFAGIGNYMHADSEVLMVLCDGCDLQMIQQMANTQGFKMECAISKKNFIETNYIFKIRRERVRVNRDELIGDQLSRFNTRDFEQLYIDLRRKENRIYSDEELLNLPHLDTTHPHAREWRIRKASADRLISFLKTSGKDLNILEVGCGNGWLSKKLASIPGSRVVGIDVNQIELEQAKRVFGEVKNLNFRHGLPSNEISGDEYFDVIVFAASIQYFKDFGEIIRFALRHLNANGQIHIMDTCFYSEGEIEDARKRSAEYFAKMGLPAMAEFYFHHSISSLRQFNYSKLFDPKTKMNKIFNRGQIFPWIVIKQDQ